MYIYCIYVFHYFLSAALEDLKASIMLFKLNWKLLERRTTRLNYCMSIWSNWETKVVFFFTATQGLQYILQFVEPCASRYFCFLLADPKSLLVTDFLKCCSIFFLQRSAKCCHISFKLIRTWSFIISRWLGVFGIFTGNSKYKFIYRKSQSGVGRN